MLDDPHPPPSRWLLRREPRFARLWAAKAVSYLGDGAALVALVVYVQQTQYRAVAVSALLLAETLPALLGPMAGWSRSWPWCCSEVPDGTRWMASAGGASQDRFNQRRPWSAGAWLRR